MLLSVLVENKREVLPSVLDMARWQIGASTGDIPANAIYADGSPIPDLSGTGYLLYELPA